MLGGRQGQVNESDGVVGGSTGQLLINRLSDNVGGVKHSWSALARALRRARHFALVEDVPCQPKARLQSFQVWNSVRPMHLFDPNCDHDY